MSNIDKEQVVEWLSSRSVLEIAGLVKDLEEKWGVSAAAPVAVAATGAVSASAAVEEKTEFNVVLADVGSNKINIIKEVRAVTGLSLADAKKLVESAPKPIKEGVGKQEADELKAKFEAAGAKIELK